MLPNGNFSAVIYSVVLLENEKKSAKSYFFCLKIWLYGKKAVTLQAFLDPGIMRRRKNVLKMVNAAIVALIGMLGVGCEPLMEKYAPMFIDNTNPAISVQQNDLPEAEPVEADLREAQD